jgi:hypothetical protein
MRSVIATVWLILATVSTAHAAGKVLRKAETNQSIERPDTSSQDREKRASQAAEEQGIRDSKFEAAVAKATNSICVGCQSAPKPQRTKSLRASSSRGIRE